MYLFTKRTRNIIKGVWTVVALLVMLSMVLTYSGFTRLSNSEQVQPRDVSPEDLASAPVSTTTDSGSLGTSSQTKGQSEATPIEPTPSTPTVPALNFGI